VRLYHFGKVCWGFGFWFLVCFFGSKVNTIVGVGVGIITTAVATGVGVGVGCSIGVDSDGVAGTINGCCGSKAGSVSSSSGVGCSGCVLGIAGAVAVAGGSIVVVAWINISLENFLYEVWVMVLDNSIAFQEVPVDSNGFVC